MPTESVAVTGGDGSHRAFVDAVARECAAIAVHEHAAQLHDATAGRLEQASLSWGDAPRAAALVHRAATERTRAVAARARAQGARDRLAAEGVSEGG